MKSINQWFSEYGESHQNPTNKLIHWICVPAIFYSIIGLLWSIPFPSLGFPSPYNSFINLATILSIFVLLFYFRLSFSIFIGIFLLISLGLITSYLIDNYSPIPLWIISIAVFIVAWIGQFYGHKIEGKKPSFLKDLQFLLIGPAWVLASLYKKLNIKI